MLWSFWIHRAFVSMKSESEGRSVMSNFLWPHGLYCPWNSPGQNIGVGSLSLLQGICPAQGLNPGPQHCRQILYQLSHQGSPRILQWVAYPFSSRSSWPRNWTRVSCIAGRFFTNWAMREAFVSFYFNIWKPHESVYGALCFYWYFFTNRKILIMCLINFSWKLDNKLKLIERIWGLGWFVFLLWGFAFPSGLYLAIQNNLNWILRPEMIWGARAGIFLNSLSVLLFRVPIWIMRTYQSPPL